MSKELLLFLVTIGGIAFLLLLVLKFKIQAFISLLLTSMLVGLFAGMPVDNIMESIEKGMGGTLGVVATLVGLGAIFGKMLEVSGGADVIAASLLNIFGKERASWALVLTGFIIAIPVFLDVGFIILVPVIYSLTKSTKRSILFFGIPLLAGLAVTHSFIPPTPGPIAVAEIIDAPLGMVIIFGAIIGIPTAIIAGPVFGSYISKKIYADVPKYFQEDENKQFSSGQQKIKFSTILLIIALPLFLIIARTILDALITGEVAGILSVLIDFVRFIGHPFAALTISTLVALYVLGIKQKVTKEKLADLTTKSLAPAGIVILVTGAGGVFKQVLIDSGVGALLAGSFSKTALPPIVLAYFIALIVRVTQGSATVAMITAAGLISPILDQFAIDDVNKALIVLAIASGATFFSHVNDSGFWLVGKYFGLNEKDTIRSWSIMETIISVCGFVLAFVLSFIF